MRNRLGVALLCLTAEAAWLSVVLSLVGWTVAQRAPLLPFMVVAALLFAAFFTGRFAPTGDQSPSSAPMRTWGLLQGALGLFAMVVAVQLGSGAAGVPGFWPVVLAQGQASGAQSVGMVLGSIAALLLWRRGISIAIDGAARRFQRVFFWGCLVVVTTALVESVCQCGVLDQALAGLFFATALCGLALAQIPADDGNAPAWYKAVGVSVIVILSLGLAAGQLSTFYGDQLSTGVSALWQVTVVWFIEVLIEIIGPLLEGLMAILQWVVQRAGGEGAEIRLPEFDALRNLRSEELASSSYEDLLQIPLAMLFLYLLYKGFMWGFRSRSNRPDSSAFDERERLDTDAQGSLSALLMELMPDWLRRRSSAGRQWRYPQNEHGITDAFKLYFSMLDAAVDTGWTFESSLTPLERVASLSDVFPDAPVAEVTACFNQACYGETPNENGRLERLRTELRAGGVAV